MCLNMTTRIRHESRITRGKDILCIRKNFDEIGNHFNLNFINIIRINDDIYIMFTVISLNSLLLSCRSSFQEGQKDLQMLTMLTGVGRTGS